MTSPTLLPSILSRSLPARALAGVYGAILKYRNNRYDRDPSLSRQAARPVISIGGIRMGGTGKTPAALLVARYLRSKNIAVGFLSRGYKRTAQDLQIVRPGESVDWPLVGDEPWMLHNALPDTWLGVHASRFRAAQELARIMPEKACFIMDDGFQHRALRRDLDIVCLHDLPENDRLFPAGNLREYADALRRAHVALLVRQSHTSDDHGLEPHDEVLRRSFPGLSVFPVEQHAAGWTNAGTGERADTPPLQHPLLVCGIARPERFLAMVHSDNRITPSAVRVFADHHRFITNDFNKTRELYSKGIITTEKDAVRLRKLNIVPDNTVWYLTIKTRFCREQSEYEFHLLIDKLFDNLH